MCTVSWRHDAHGYDLLCNRDERLTRPRALAPRIRTIRGVRYVAPTDPAGGGAWIAVNEQGVSACLLNAHPRGWSAPHRQLSSRGQLLLDVIGRTNLFDAVAQVAHRDLTEFAPFTMLFLQTGLRATVVLWDGQYTLVLPDADSRCPLASSSVDERRTVRLRTSEWRRRRPDNVSAMIAYHRSHAGGVCMHRPDAETLSFTHITVSPDRVQLHYWPDSPCRDSFIVTTTLERADSHDKRTSAARLLDTAG